MFDAEFNTGTKSLSNTGMKRMSELAEWAMQRPEETVVCTGHSLYFRSFFRVSMYGLTYRHRDGSRFNGKKTIFSRSLHREVLVGGECTDFCLEGGGANLVKGVLPKEASYCGGGGGQGI